MNLTDAKEAHGPVTVYITHRNQDAKLEIHFQLIHYACMVSVLLMAGSHGSYILTTC